MLQCASSITTAFSSASWAPRSLRSFRLLALLGLKGALVCPSGRCDIGCRYVWGVQGCKVGSYPPPDELAGICTGWITRQRESIIQKDERKHRACGPRVPFPIQGMIFPKMWRVREKNQPWRSEGGTMRSRGWCYICLCVSSHLFSALAPSWSDPGVKIQNAIIGPSGRTNATFMMDECGI